MKKIKIRIGTTEYEVESRLLGEIEIIPLKVKVTVEKGSFLHIGASPSPLSEKKGAVFKIDQLPVIPASSFKGAMRYQLEQLFIQQKEELCQLLKVSNPELLKPCIPSPAPTAAERNLGVYRKNACQVKTEELAIDVCPVCYFMGAAGLMGFLRFNNLLPPEGDWLVDQTNIRIDRATNTAAYKAKVDGEQVKPGTTFTGEIEIIVRFPQGFEFGSSRKLLIDGIDKWLKDWQEPDSQKRKEILVNKIIVPALANIKFLGGQKSKGAGRIKVDLVIEDQAHKSGYA